MHRRHIVSFAFSALLLAACSSGSGSTSSSSGSGGAGSSIPDPGPGDNVDNDFANVEPNDSPSQATPLGTAAGPGVYMWVTMNTIGGGDDSDYFVFNGGPKAGQFTLGSSGLCFSGGIKTLSASLWKVEAGQQVMPPVHHWTTSSGCLMSKAGDAPIEANTDYLLGITATGGSGTYAA